MRHFSLLAALAAIACGSTACGSSPQLVRLPEAPPPALVIHDVDVLDVETGRVARGRDVLLSGDRIAAIGLAGHIPEAIDAERIDGSGATLVPGLIDMHGHVVMDSSALWAAGMPDPEANLQSYLYCGVTTVLDPSDPTPDAFERRDDVASGALVGPRIYTAGTAFTAVDGHPVSFVRNLAPWWIAWYLAPKAARQLASAEEAPEKVREVLDAGADVVKIIVDELPAGTPKLSADTVRAIVSTAQRRDVRAVAHIGSVDDALVTGRAGIAAWVHGVYEERIPDEAIPTLAAFGIPMIATLHVFDSYAQMPNGARVPTSLERETVPAEALAAFNDPPADSPLLDTFGPWLETMREMRSDRLDNVRRLRAAGVTILAGSDTQSGIYPGPGLHRELALLREAGLSPAEAIRAATLDSARFLARSDDPDFGSVALGKRADLLLVEGDPIADPEAISKIREVIQAGVRVERMSIGGPG